MTEYQVLRARRSADRVGLHEPELVKGAFERGRREEAVRNCIPAQVVQSNRSTQRRHFPIVPRGRNRWVSTLDRRATNGRLRYARRASYPRAERRVTLHGVLRMA